MFGSCFRVLTAVVVKKSYLVQFLVVFFLRKKVKKEMEKKKIISKITCLALLIVSVIVLDKMGFS